MQDDGTSWFFTWREARAFNGTIERDVPVRFERGAFVHPVTGRSVAQAIAVERLGPRYHDHDALEPRDETGDLLEPMQIGTVDRYDPERGWGHIQTHGRGTIFFHASAVAGERSLTAGDHVRFCRTSRPDREGRLRYEAAQVALIDAPGEGPLDFEPPEAAILQGTVTHWDRDGRGFGRILVDGTGESLFAHWREVAPGPDGFRGLNVSDRVTFRRALDNTRPDLPARFQAVDIAVIEPGVNVQEE
jgi:cold shock CspA family protein